MTIPRNRRRRPVSDEEGLRPLTDPGLNKSLLVIAVLGAILVAGALLLLRGLR